MSNPVFISILNSSRKNKFLTKINHQGQCPKAGLGFGLEISLILVCVVVLVVSRGVFKGKFLNKLLI